MNLVTRGFIAYINPQCENKTRERVKPIMKITTDICHKEKTTTSAQQQNMREAQRSTPMSVVILMLIFGSIQTLQLIGKIEPEYVRS
jgi:hypothetical protein